MALQRNIRSIRGLVVGNRVGSTLYKSYYRVAGHYYTTMTLDNNRAMYYWNSNITITIIVAVDRVGFVEGSCSE
jgi:hypothetical protein